jgi:hypothetical protein
MSLIKKCDLKKYFASRRRKGAHPVRSAGEPLVAGSAVVDRANAEVNQAAFVDDFSLEHCSPGGGVTAKVKVKTGHSSLVPVVPITPES